MDHNSGKKADEGGVRKTRKQALGRGLGALIPGLPPVSESKKDFFQCDIDRIRPNRYQPRRTFSQTELAELAESIREEGILVPLMVRPLENDQYELIAGERRLRAAQMAGLTKAPVITKDVGDEKLLLLSIVENIQREDLNPMEESEAYHLLMADFGLTQETVADRVGKSRSAVANFLRLQQLQDQIRDSLASGDISMGHAKALLGADNPAQQLEAWRITVAKALSVRDTENLVRRLKQKAGEPKPPKSDPERDYFTGLSEELSRHFGTKVDIKRRGKKGKLEIEFYDNHDLDRLLKLLDYT